jgi:hypothetical protein
MIAQESRKISHIFPPKRNVALEYIVPIYVYSSANQEVFIEEGGIQHPPESIQELCQADQLVELPTRVKIRPDQYLRLSSEGEVVVAKRGGAGPNSLGKQVIYQFPMPVPEINQVMQASEINDIIRWQAEGVDSHGTRKVLRVEARIVARHFDDDFEIVRCLIVDFGDSNLHCLKRDDKHWYYQSGPQLLPPLLRVIRVRNISKWKKKNKQPN